MIPTVGPPMPASLAQLKERIAGNDYTAQREKEFKALSANCPPIDPHLIRHLKTVFSDVTSVKPTHPALTNMLLVQHGVNKVLKYLETKFDAQTEMSRARRAV